ncbi:hypothetical protein BD410DRAFT_263445 [Rickenella mellea]|uniref:Uncharacterized protein n=1 Tax=Rickenella mellea TaxID=50990 RepID=A0A4Y7Q493_9AGAM|nr:hypothetical protein BD410DRAFT_263445 [Rickenella mellea]
MEITLENVVHDHESDDNVDFLYRSNDQFFPYGSTIYIRISTNLDWTGHCTDFSFLHHLTQGSTIANTVHIEASMGAFRYLTPDEWEGNSLLRHLRFSHCDQLTEQNLASLATRFVEEFMLDLCDEPKVKEMLRWEV